MNSNELRRKLTDELRLYYHQGEASKLAFLLIYHVFGLSHAKIIAGVDLDDNLIVSPLERLKQYEPIEYIFEKAVFLGETLYVNPSVLIPRPETEELVLLLHSIAEPSSIVDVCCGSGCIAKGLASAFPKSKIEAWDISRPALEVARKNLPERVIIREIDFLNPAHWPEQKFDLIVSNPPYLTQKDREYMQPNVLKYEPEIALFARGDDDLIFYRKLSLLAQHHLLEAGVLAVEINESKGEEVVEIFAQAGFEPRLHQDINKKNRFVSLRK